MLFNSYVWFENSKIADVSIEVVVYILALSTEARQQRRERRPRPAAPEALLGVRKREFGNLSHSGKVSSSNPRLVEGLKLLLRLT